MAHIHPVVDGDAHFVISSTTREITTSSTRLELMQGDHQSERITFEIPRIVEGHDMSLCDRIKIHYTNTDKKTKATKKDVYIVDDVTVENDTISFSWLISGNATKYYGKLAFTVVFECLDENGDYTYRWSTEICNLLSVGEGINNTKSTLNSNPDALEKFRYEVTDEVTNKVLAAVPKDVVKFSEQKLTNEEKNTAVTNIGAMPLLYHTHGEVLAESVYDSTTGKYVIKSFLTELPCEYSARIGEFNPEYFSNGSISITTSTDSDTGFAVTVQYEDTSFGVPTIDEIKAIKTDYYAKGGLYLVSLSWTVAFSIVQSNFKPISDYVLPTKGRKVVHSQNELRATVLDDRYCIICCDYSGAPADWLFIKSFGYKNSSFYMACRGIALKGSMLGDFELIIDNRYESYFSFGFIDNIIYKDLTDEQLAYNLPGIANSNETKIVKWSTSSDTHPSGTMTILTCDTWTKSHGLDFSGTAVGEDGVYTYSGEVGSSYNIKFTKVPTVITAIITQNDDGTYSSDKTFEELSKAIEDGKVVQAVSNGMICSLYIASTDSIIFTASDAVQYPDSPYSYVIVIGSDNNIELYNAPAPNLTHWTDYVGGSDLINQQTVTFETNDSGYAIGEVTLANMYYSPVPEQVTVVFDGTEYSCKVNTAPSMPDMVFFGNLSLDTGTFPSSSDTGEPFLLELALNYYTETEQMVYQAKMMVKTAGEHTVQVSYTDDVVHKLPEKYLPDLPEWVASKYLVPAITTDFNKIPAVVSRAGFCVGYGSSAPSDMQFPVWFVDGVSGTGGYYDITIIDSNGVAWKGQARGTEWTTEPTKITAETKQSIPKIESLDTSNIKTFRSIEDGIYVLDGYFTPYTGYDSTFIFDPPALVSISSTDSETHVQIFEAYNNQIQHLVITDTTCETTYVPLNDIAKSVGEIGDLTTLKTASKDTLVDAINELAAAIPTVTASDNGKFLQVVDGAWAATTVSNANGVSF